MLSVAWENLNLVNLKATSTPHTPGEMGHEGTEPSKELHLKNKSLYLLLPCNLSLGIHTAFKWTERSKAV